jgi:hypothetical protein
VSTEVDRDARVSLVQIFECYSIVIHRRCSDGCFRVGLSVAVRSVQDMTTALDASAASGPAEHALDGVADRERIRDRIEAEIAEAAGSRLHRHRTSRNPSSSPLVAGRRHGHAQPAVPVSGASRRFAPWRIHHRWRSRPANRFRLHPPQPASNRTPATNPTDWNSAGAATALPPTIRRTDQPHRRLVQPAADNHRPQLKFLAIHSC